MLTVIETEQPEQLMYWLDEKVPHGENIDATVMAYGAQLLPATSGELDKARLKLCECDPIIATEVCGIGDDGPLPEKITLPPDWQVSRYGRCDVEMRIRGINGSFNVVSAEVTYQDEPQHQSESSRLREALGAFFS